MVLNNYFLWLTLAFVLTVSDAAESTPATNTTDFQYKGISIGGWLVLEPYITPSLFNKTLNENETSSEIPVDEYHFCEKLGKKEASKRLEEHWSTFYNETDFQEIRQHGLNMVRLPIGYWAFEPMDDDPYVMGAQDYLDKAIEWSAENDLKVLIDLHGAPNSQNGFDNSGLRNIGYPGWQNKTEYVDHTIKVLQQVYAKYGGENYSDVVIGIEVLNEPFGPKLDMTDLKKFYIDTYRDAREIQTVNNSIFFHDAFQSISYWDDFLTKGSVKYQNHTNSTNGTNSTNHTNSTNGTRIDKVEFNNIYIDHHHYEVFGNVVADNVTQHLNNIVNYSKDIAKEKHRAIVGEWSAALTDCSPWLNGVGLGSRYEGTDPYDNDRVGNCNIINRSGKKWTKEQKKDHRRFVEMQLYQYSQNTNGWIFWCWKTEGGAIEWDFRQLADLEIIPQPLDNYKYVKNGVDISAAARVYMSSPYSLMTFCLLTTLMVFY
ncbi:glucan exo-1,3-beta-glucosidase [Lodderomyces elongisporus]|uniref:glucan exo-1,3-beta-glucosidase n=1 Tax=Lodderomyces elongisporus TaxID=36914 RepID=UPI0029249F83|nr:glucan exo-1,3-beta-glucosidase [Lodderomyces elongisporus]WLF77852.1 glucan exo-1,3-beta-glucosidase [Lodderomyces elongisporus]